MVSSNKALTLFSILFSVMLQDAQLNKGIFILFQTDGSLFDLLQVKDTSKGVKQGGILALTLTFFIFFSIAL